MKVVQLAQHFAPVIGGEERHVENLTRHLSGLGHEVHVLTQALDGQASLEEHPAGFAIHRLPSLSARTPGIHADPHRPHAFPFPDPVMARALSRAISRLRPDVVHGHNWLVNSYLPSHRRSERPLVMTLHSYSHRCANTRYMRNDAICEGPGPRKCLACSVRTYGAGKGPVMYATTWLMKPARERLIARFLPVSSAVARGAGLLGSGVPYEVLPNFIPDALADRHAHTAMRPTYLPSEAYLVYVGDLARDKGVLTIVDAYAGMPSPKPELLLVGRRTESTPSSVPDGVTLAFDWEHARVIDAFRHAEAAVLPSRWLDPCPTTVLEAMALGAPLVTTAVGGIADMVDDASAVLTEPGDVASLRAGMTRILADAGLRERLRTAAAERVRPFLASAVVRRVAGIYEELVQARP